MDNNFVCCICHSIPANVVESACCNSLFCWDCVIGVPKICPSCSKLLDPATCTENLAVKKIVEAIEVKCKYAGCFERFLVSDRPSHEATCPRAPILCPNSELCGILERRDITHHLQVCQFRQIECHMCEVTLPLPHLQEHLDTVCPEVVAECRLCRAKILRKNLTSHIEGACPNVETECPFSVYGCPERPFRCQVEQHVSENMANHMRLMGNAFQEQQQQINALRDQLDLQQREAVNVEPETGVLHRLDQHLTAFIQNGPNWGLIDHPIVAHIRSHQSRRCAFGLFLFALLVLKVSFCLIFSHRCALLWTGVKLVKMLVKCVVIVKVCAMVIGRVWRGAAWMHSNRHFAAAVIALSIFVHFLIFG